MRPERTLPETTPSIGDESISMTMQAEVGHMTLDEAIASGLFDIAEEPGMVRIPITLNVMIPGHLLRPAGQAADHGPGEAPFIDVRDLSRPAAS